MSQGESSGAGTVTLSLQCRMNALRKFRHIGLCQQWAITVPLATGLPASPLYSPSHPASLAPILPSTHAPPPCSSVPFSTHSRNRRWNDNSSVTGRNATGSGMLVMLPPLPPPSVGNPIKEELCSSAFVFILLLPPLPLPLLPHHFPLAFLSCLLLPLPSLPHPPFSFTLLFFPLRARPTPFFLIFFSFLRHLLPPLLYLLLPPASHLLTS